MSSLVLKYFLMKLKNPPKDYQSLFFDMNAYFASVEQQVQPTLRGEPVGITPYTGGTGCIIARSYEAKDWGIDVGCLVREAKKKCPKIKIVEARPALYQLYHREILNMLNKISPNATPLSIDEFAVRLTGSDMSYIGSKRMADKIKSKLKIIGDSLTCSIGIAPNMFLAKVAAESQKPDGLTIITLKKLDQFYRSIKLRDIPGFNFRMERQLAHRKIFSVHQLYEKDMVTMSRILNHPGKVWWHRLRGYEVDDFEIKTRSCGHSHVLAPEFRTKERAISVIEKLVTKSAYRLRRQKFFARGVTVYVRFYGRNKYYKAKSCDQFNDTKTFRNHVKDMLKECDFQDTPMMVAVSAFNLVRDGKEQISIFKEVEKSKQISRALDKVNDQYGVETVYTGSSHLGIDSAPDRIPFGKPRYEIKNF